MRQDESSISRKIIVIAGVLVSFVTIIVPVGYFVISYHHISQTIETEVQLNAQELSRVISTNPELWMYESARLQDLLSWRLGDKEVEGRRVYTLDNALVAEDGVQPSPPLLKKTARLTDAAVTVGRIEIARSLRPLLFQTAVIAAAAVVVGAVVFIALRILPLRTVRLAEQSLLESEAKYRSLVESTDDTIFLVDRDYRYLFVNHAYLERGGLSSAEILGRPYEAFHSLEETAEFREKAEHVFRDGRSLQYEHLSRRSNTPYLRTLSPVRAEGGMVTAVTVVSKNILEQKRLEEELRALSLSDELTGLSNRRGFITLADQQLKTAVRLGRKAILFSTDLDRLKEINDGYGHKEGDRALKAAAGILRESFRETDIIARIGGDEFVALLVEHPDFKAGVLKQRLLKNVDLYNRDAKLPYRLSLSIGSAESIPQAPVSLAKLMELADGVMYEEKKLSRKNR